MIGLVSQLAATPALAGNINAVINGKSFHLNASRDWNEANVGFGFEYEFAQRTAWKKIVMVNGFLDSDENPSYMAGGGLHRRLFQSERPNGLGVYAGLNVFVMTREDVRNNKPFPGVIPSLTIWNDKFGMNLTYIPRKGIGLATDLRVVDPTLSGVVFLQFKVSLDQLMP